VDVKLKTDITTEPVTTAYIKNYLKMGEQDTAEDALIVDLVKAARQAIEGIIQRPLAEKTYVVEFDGDDVSDDEFELPFAPIASVTSLKTVDAEGAESEALTLNTDYHVLGNQKKRVYLNTSFVSLDNSLEYNYRVEYVCGYGANGCELLPAALKMAVCELVNQWYYNRGMQGIVPSSIYNKIYPYMIWSEI
jgi:uncharacterized phiE125 gp8 family phage protein